MAKIVCRLANAEDLVAIADIEETAHERPWSLGQLTASLGKKSEQLWVLEYTDAVQAWAAVQCVQSESELLQISVRPSHRRRGFGMSLLKACLRALHEQGVREMFLEVRISNAAAIAMYEQAGFCEYGRRAGYYPSLNPQTPNGREDALLMAWPGTPVD